MAASSEEDGIMEEREELMASATGGIPCMRIAHFLKPIVPSTKASNLKLPFLSPKSKWPLHVDFNGWRDPQRKWVKWVEKMQSKFHYLWKKAGIFEAIMCSKYRFHRNDDLVFGITERWCSDTNTFVFPWGEATITLEDVMILGGFSILGSSVLLPVAGKELVEAEDRLRKLLKYFLRVKCHNHLQWLNCFMDSKRRDEHEAFLSLWLSRFVFPGNEFDQIGEHTFPIAVQLSRGTRIALAPAVLASIYRDLGLLKESMAVSSKLEAESGEENILAVGLCAPLQLIQLWAWERFLIFQPKPNFIKFGEMRAARWAGEKRDDIGNVRPIIDSCGDIFLWRPYTLAVDEWSFPKFYKEKEEWLQIGIFLDEEMESFARCLRVCMLVGIDCEEPYQPHRVAMQFGFDQDIPALFPRSTEFPEVAWINYSKPFNNDSILYLPARLFESDLSVQYQRWWRQTVQVPVCSFKGILRGHRSSRLSNLRQTKVNEGAYPRNTNTLVARQKNSTKVQIKVESINFDVPPGFPPKREPNSSAKIENSRRKQLKRNGNDDGVGVPPGYPVKIENVPILRPVTHEKKQIKEEGNDSEVPKKDHCLTIWPETSAKLEIKAECIDVGDPIGFPSKNDNKEIVRPESSTKNQNCSSGRVRSMYCCCRSIMEKSTHGRNPSSTSQTQGKCLSTEAMAASESVHHSS